MAQSKKPVGVAKSVKTVRKVPEIASASVEGDVYVLTKGGDIKKSAANEVQLIRLPVGPDFMIGFDSVCAVQRVRNTEDSDGPSNSIAAINAKLELIFARARANTRELAAYTASQGSYKAPTGVNAHYVLTDVPPGQYVVHSLMVLGDDNHEWYVPINLKSGEKLRLDLDNNNLDQRKRHPCDSHEPLPTP